MNKIIYIITTLSIIAACQDKKEPKIFTRDSTGKVGFTDSSFIKVVDSFYNWYILENYAGPDSFSSRPRVIQLSDTLYQLDSKGHLEALEKTGLFTERFIENERKLIEDCNKSIIENKWMADSELDFSGCDYFSYDRWIGGQGEEINGYEIASVLLNDDKQIIKVETLINGSPFMTVLVTTVPEGGSYKIDAISARDIVNVKN